tara:strand:+ start:6368 stop:6757 length:390 start_codon:yes stop_codon:yes gene_type:complete
MVKNIMDETKKGFMQNIGDLSFKRIDDSNFEFSIKVVKNFLNTGGIAHGGFISTISDTGMGNAAHIAAGNKRCVTIDLNIKFISAGKLDEKLIGKVKVLKKTRTLVFIYCEILDSSNIVATASGTWKIL